MVASEFFFMIFFLFFFLIYCICVMHKNSENDGALNPYIFHMHIIKRIKAIYFFFKIIT